ncbi:hypothetical protein CORT_0G03420 [Candida orthopsilosis Co 90-125]|uniref:Uncharacterized protein n=1 Tax=Candida orthopsilosis (strain 90-125) TaxID=1136231 RepID=H8XA41_CANO9|nr:hypothetical protein CORT_0G03420 [Candida orthopsilosis Co 90-125]CCG25018.1 hypothetical protein CORT_0G03420 [Candida orthopsilosis Co 90-125]
MPQNMKSLFKPKTNNSSSVTASTSIAKGSGFTSTSTPTSTPTTTITTTDDFTSLYPTISSTSSTSVIVHSNKSHASSNNKANANSSTSLSQHCYIKNGQLQRSSSGSSSSGKTGKQSRPKFPTRTSSFLTRLKSTAKRIRSNDSATTSTSSSWCKTNKTLSASKPTEQSLYESQQKQPVGTTSTEPTAAIEATFDIDEASSTVSSAPSSILSNIAQTSYDAFTTSNKTQDQAHNYSIDIGVYADYDDNDEMESIISFDSMLGSNEIELEDEDITYITPLNYNYMYDNNNNEEGDQFDYKFDYTNGEQDNEEDSFVNDRELERRELRLELLKNFS